MVNSFVKIGKIKDAHSLKGEVYVLVFSGEVAWANQMLDHPVQVGDQLMQVEKYRLHKQGIIIKFKNFENRNQAEEIKGQMFYVPDVFLTSVKGESIYLNEVLGFEVNNVGVIKGFSSNGAQDLVVVDTGKGEHEIPFIKEFIEKIDFEQKIVFMNIPEGLIE